MDYRRNKYGKKIINYRSGLALFQKQYEVSEINGQVYPPEIIQMFDNGEPNTRWSITDVTSNPPLGVFQIINANSSKALSANRSDNKVTQSTNLGFASQQWSFSGYNDNGYLAIINRNTQQALEIGGGGDLTQPDARLICGIGGLARTSNGHCLIQKILIYLQSKRLVTDVVVRFIIGSVVKY